MSSPALSVGRRLLAAAVMGAVLATLALLVVPMRASAEYVNCPNESLRNGPSASLPDCRAYELVSPPDKNGGQVDGGLAFETEQPPWQATPNGAEITYGSQTTFTEANPESSMTTTQYLAKRGTNGWITQTITPKQFYPYGRVDESGGTENESLVQGFSEDLTTAFIVADEPAPVSGAPAGYYSPYLRREGGEYELLSSVTPPATETGPGDCCTNKFNVQYAGMSKDDRHVIFMANDALTEHAIPGQVNLYESTDGKLELVNVLPDGETYESKTSSTLNGFGFGGPVLESLNGVWSNFDHAISDDGSRVFWSTTVPDPQVYMRELTASGPRTVQVSASQRHETAAQRPTHYWYASADGSLVYFSTCAQLTEDSTAAPEAQGSFSSVCGFGDQINEGLQGQDLYQYETNTGHLADVTVDHNSGEAADFKGVLGASEDGSYVYFVAEGVLASGATAGEDNLYLWHEGATSFIASIGKPAMGGFYEGESETSDWDEGLTVRTSRVTPDGLHLAFQSYRSLTGYDNQPTYSGACGAYWANAKCSEVFEYSASTKTLECASCRPSGLPPEGNSSVPNILRAELVGLYPGWQSTTLQQRYLSNDGSRLFFVSEDALLPQASNGQQNVYEYEQDGVGNCQTPAGCLSLLSTGTSNGPSFFVEASTDGGNAFLVTRQQLVSQDGDEQTDLYDARVDGGFQPLEAPPCSGEACRAPATPAPAIYGAPPSATFVGSGNPRPVTAGKPTVTVKKTTKCPKGKKRAKGRCVKAKAKKKRKAKKAARRGRASNATRRSK